MAVFEELNALNINEHTEKKKTEGKELTYLSWPWAWAEVKKRYPDAHYTIWKNADGLPYTEDPLTGYMVYTSVTINEVTHEMWLPVMNGANRAMKRTPYKYLTKFGEKSVEAATMMDINKTIMRCLVKNLAMFGLGLYIYAGEDLPEGAEAAPTPPAGPEFTRPDVAEPSVTKVTALPPKEKKTESTPVMTYLLQSMTALREKRGISAKENNELFKKQRDALVNAKLAPNKGLEEYTMDEAVALIDAMDKCFKGSELKVQ